MATYKEIQSWVKNNFCFVPKSCWIAHVKELNGLNPRRSPNRQGPDRQVPCPLERRKPIEAAMRHFGMIE